MATAIRCTECDAPTQTTAAPLYPRACANPSAFRPCSQFWRARLAGLLLASLWTGLGATAAAAQERAGSRAHEMHAWLMASTFKLEAPGSLGTGFILGLPYADAPEEWRHVLVTSAHVLQRVIGDEATLVMRARSESGGWSKQRVRIRIRYGDKAQWVRHRDVDVAAMYVELPAEAVPKPLLHVDVLATDERLVQYQIHPGDELLCLGYPFGLEASEPGFPILQRGTIASYPLLPSREVKTFLVGVQLFPGHSGGPVYMAEKPTVEDGRVAYSSIKSIVGLLSEERAIQKQIEGVVELQDSQHPLGLARVVHATLIRETIALLPNVRGTPSEAGAARR